MNTLSIEYYIRESSQRSQSESNVSTVDEQVVWYLLRSSIKIYFTQVKLKNTWNIQRNRKFLGWNQLRSCKCWRSLWYNVIFHQQNNLLYEKVELNLFHWQGYVLECVLSFHIHTLESLDTKTDLYNSNSLSTRQGVGSIYWLTEFFILIFWI